MTVQFIQSNLGIVALALLSAGMLLWPPISRKLSGVREVGVAEATQLMNHQNAVVLDVREESEFYSGHIAHSKHIPLGALSKRLGELEKFKGRAVVVSCRSGARSSRACGVLRKNGFEQVYNLAGGIIAWEQANMPVEKK